jgi:2-oxoglutarate ferredoxin oxidoreductase subunit delta
MPRIVISPDLCKGCELCVDACPQLILGMGRRINSKGYFYAVVVEQMRCIGSLCCITCPDWRSRCQVQHRYYHYFSY